LRCRQVQVIRLYDEVPIRVSRHMAYRWPSTRRFRDLRRCGGAPSLVL